MRIRRVGLLGDLHTGSAFAPWPAGAELSCGGTHQPNVGQSYLNERMGEIAAALPPLDVIVFTGDLIDGQMPKDRGRYLVEIDPQFQARAAYELVRPIAQRATVVYVVEGTEYHDSDGSMWMEWLARELGAVAKDQHVAWDWLLADMFGLKWDIAHKQSIMIRYKSTAMEREMQFSSMLSETADVIVRSHAHFYGFVQLATDGIVQTSVSTPAWKMQGHYERTSLSPNRLYSSKLGMVVLEVEDGNVIPRPFLFPHPPLRRSVYVTA